LEKSMDPVRVRFAPSPTGHLHLGSARTALYDYLIARKTGGQFILRIEDTDQKRLVEGAEQEIYQGLKWLGLDWDEGPDVGGPYGPYKQSERKSIYQKYAKELIESGHAYYCFCTPERLNEVRQEQQKRKEMTLYDGKCRTLSLEEAAVRVKAGEKHVIRFKTPKDGSTTLTDLLRGEITVENKNLDDYIIVKSDGLALYHLAAAVDDHLMRITHVIRSSEWLPTAPLHSMIHQAFGWNEPVWVHLSVFLKPSGKGKMSKRDAAELVKDGHSIFIKELEKLGYLPEAVLNWIALMGWSYDDHTEFFTKDELIEKFSLEKLNPSPAAINFQKFDYFNANYIRILDNEDLATRIRPFFEELGITIDFPTLAKIAPIIRERLTTLDDAIDMAGFFFKDFPRIEVDQLIGKDMTKKESAQVIETTLNVFNKLPILEKELTESQMRIVVDKEGWSAGQAFGILRIAITGQKVSPPLFESIAIIGKDVVMERLESALNILKGGV
jgi:glutamyl-tRNA synthetase